MSTPESPTPPPTTPEETSGGRLADGTRLVGIDADADALIIEVVRPDGSVYYDRVTPEEWSARLHREYDSERDLGGAATIDSVRVEEIPEPESIEDEARRERDEDEKDRAWKEHRSGEPEATVPETEGIPDHILAKAAEHRVPIEYLRLAERNHHAARTLRSKYGIDWGLPEAPPPVPFGRKVPRKEIMDAETLNGVQITPEYIDFARAEAQRGNLRPADSLKGLGVDIGAESMDPEDPVVRINEIGRMRRREVAELSRQLEVDPLAVKRTLERPAHVRFIPFGTYVNKRILAWRITRKEIKDRPKKAAELEAEFKELAALGVRDRFQQEIFEKLPKLISDLRSPHDDGLWGLGLNHYAEHLRVIKRLDESIKAHRKQLSRMDRHQLRGPNSAHKRSQLAYRIFDARQSVDKTKHLELQDMDDPMMAHNHELFKKNRSRFMASVLPRE